MAFCGKVSAGIDNIAVFDTFLVLIKTAAAEHKPSPTFYTQKMSCTEIKTI
jgi:hypothetical protein